MLVQGDGGQGGCHSLLLWLMAGRVGATAYVSPCSLRMYRGGTHGRWGV